jgi:hypothetical protein
MPARYTIPFITIALTVLAALAPFFFSWPYALALGFFAACFFPPAILIVGAFLDLLYFNGHGIPHFTLVGLVGSVIFTFVQQFLKARIMS